MFLNYITWDVSPTIFSIGPVEVRWYGLLFAMAFVAGYFIMQKIFEKEGIKIEVLDKLASYMVIATVIGARLGHCLFYQPDYYLKNPIDILKIWEGGLASHGAAIAIILSLWLFARLQKKPYLWVLDRIVIVVALAGVFIRTGNLMNSEIYGHATDLPWGFLFSHYEQVPKHPTQIYEALSYLMIFAYLLYYYFKTDGKPIPGRIFGIFLVTLFGMRFLIEFLKEDQVAFEAGMSLNMGQLLSIPFVLIGSFLIYRSTKK